MVNNNSTYALILGGTTGLGFATVKKLAEQGYNVIVIHRTLKKDLKPFQEFINTTKVEVKTFSIDATLSKNISNCIETLVNTIPAHRIKVLVHSIAKGRLKPIIDSNSILTIEDYNLTIQAMGTSLLAWTQAIFSANLFSVNAKVIAFTSEGNTKVIPNYGAISASKVVLESIIKQIAVEFSKFNITANAIQAGVTDTASLQLIPNADQIIKLAKQRNPNKRLTTPEDVANVVSLLVKDEANWITGNIIKVDGGEHLQ